MYLDSWFVDEVEVFSRFWNMAFEIFYTAKISRIHYSWVGG